MRTFRIFVSSPGDVAEERLIARRVIERLRARFAGNVEIEPIFWEHEPLVASASFQDQLPHPSEAHAVICILWSRLGTRLPPTFRKPDGSHYASGTEFEFENALAGFRSRGWPALLVYRKSATPDLADDDDVVAMEKLRQKQSLDAFVRRWFHDETDGTLRAAFHPFSSAEDFEEIIEIHLQKLIARQYPEALGADASQAASWRHESPFRGLQAFEYEHAPIFFGRTAAVTQMLSALRAQARGGGAFLLVLGASGSGKSSVVRAGLLPVLTQPGVIEGISDWNWTSLRPRDAVDGRLVELVHRSLDRALAGWSQDGELADRLEALAREPRRIALFIDQLEEVYSASTIDSAERTRFFELLKRLVATGAVWVVATVRSDFYPRVAESPALIDLKAGSGQYDLLPPSPAEIGQMIRLPAAAAGLRYEMNLEGGERLDEVLRDAAVASPESLPLLEFALEELYKRRSGDGTLTFAAYHAIGGVEGALAQRAESVFQQLPPRAAGALPAVLRKLIAAHPGSDVFSRRSAALPDFEDAGERELVEALVSSRLCVSELDNSRRPVVSIAHEALLRHWPRVRDWLEENRELLRAKSRLSASAERWAHEQFRPDLLLTAGRPLEEATAVAAAGIELTSDERGLIRASARRASHAKRLRLAAVGGLAILAIAATAAALVATSQRQRARNEAATSQETMDFMVGLFTLADPTEARANAVTVREILDRGAADVKSQLKDRPEVRSNLMTAMGRAYTGLGLAAPAREMLAEAIEVRSTIEAQRALAAATYLGGDYETSRQLYETALKEARARSPQGDAQVAAILQGLGETYSQLGIDEESEQSWREAIDIETRLHGSGNAQVANAKLGLAITLYYIARYEEAEQLTQESIAELRGSLGPNHWKVADALNHLGALQFQTGRYDEAVSAWKECLAISEEWAGKDHPENATVANNIGRGLLIEGHLDEARVYLEKSFDVWQRTRPADHDDLVLSLNSLAMIDMSDGKWAGAEARLDRAAQIGEKQNHRIMDQVLVNLADLYARTGRPAQARPLLERARALLEEQYPLAEMPDEAWRYALQDSVRGSVYTAEKNYADAEKLLLASLPVIEKRFGAQRFYTTTTRQRLAALYGSWGKPKLAARYQP